MLLELDDHQLRYELDMGAVIVRETLLRIIEGLKEKQRKLKASAVQASALRAKNKKKNSARAAASEDDDSDENDSDQSEPLSSDDDFDDDSGDHAGKRMNAPRSKREKEAAAAAKARARQSRDAKRKTEQQELELTMLVRVGASVSALSVVYSLLAQSLESWHHRSVKMSGPNEDMEFATSLGIWSFSSKGHYHNDNMYSKLVPESSGKRYRYKIGEGKLIDKCYPLIIPRRPSLSYSCMYLDCLLPFFASRSFLLNDKQTTLNRLRVV